MAVSGASMRLGLAAIVVAGLTACAATFTNHGYAPTDAELAEITVGVSTRDSVEEAIGRPASTGVVGNDAWYYMSSQVRHFTYREAEVIDRQLVAVSFSKRGVVQNVERFTLEDGRVVVLQRRVTETNIGSISFIRQLLGNLGRISPGS